MILAFVQTGIIGIVLYLYFNSKNKTVIIEKKENQKDKEMNEHFDAIMNYTPEIAYKKVKNG